MRAWSKVSTRLFHRSVKGAWLTLAAGSLAGLAVLGACSDNVSKVTGDRGIPDSPVFVGVVGSNAHLITVCVDPTSDQAPGNADFVFTSAANTAPGGTPAWFEDKSLPPDPVLVPLFLAAQNSLGPFPLGAFLSDQIITPVGAKPGECENVFIRANTCPGGVCGVSPFDHAGNRLWTLLTGQGVINPFGAVNITGTIPPGYSAAVSCTNDDPALPQSCTNGGYSSANVFHGSSFTFKFTAPQVLPCPAGSFTWLVDGSGNLQITYDQFPAPNDNSYGANSVGWKPNRPHRFKDLVNSDHAGILLKNASGQTVLSFNMDYLSKDAGSPSGYKSLGVTGGDGGMLVGTATGITVTTSLANNLNNINIPGLFNPATHVQLIGSVDVLEDSPPTDPAHQTYNITDAALAGWDFHNTYFATISAAKLAAIGFNPATWTVAPNASQLHNSPAKECPVVN
jgi:hypothetical protein